MPQSLEDELRALEEYKKELEEEACVEQEISDVKTRIRKQRE